MGKTEGNIIKDYINKLKEGNGDEFLRVNLPNSLKPLQEVKPNRITVTINGIEQAIET